MNRRAFIQAGPLACLAPAFAQDRAPLVERGLRPRVRIEGQPEERWTVSERMQHHKVPGVSVTVLSGSRVEWSRSWGVIESGSSRPVNLNTLFQAASISKPVTALAVLRLVAQRKLDLDADINRYLTRWKLPPHAFGKPVTLRLLLTHTAGTTVHGFPGYRTGTPVPSLADVLNGKGNTPAVVVDTEPGTKWRYSGGGYEIIQQVVEEVTQRPFAVTMKRLVLDPLDLTGSTYEQPLPAALAGNAARGHDRSGKPVEGGWHVYPEQAAAGLWTRPLDLARVLVAVQHAARGDTRFLPAKLSGEMLSAGQGSYGLGWSLGGKEDNQWFAHGGANAGFRCYAVAWPKLGFGAVVMANSDNGSALSDEILRSVSTEYGWPEHRQQIKKPVPLTAEQLSAFVGVYVFGEQRATVVAERERLRLTVGPQSAEYLPESANRFFTLADGSPSVIVFETGTDGQVTGVRAGNVSARRIQ